MEDLLGDPDVDALGDPHRVRARLGQIAPQLVHLVRRFDVELVGVELHPVRVGHRLPGADAEQHVVRGRILPLEIVRVVGGDDGQFQLACHANQALVDRVLLLHPVAHHLDVEAVAEDLAIRLRVAQGFGIVVAQQRCRNQAGHAAGEDDQALVVLRQELEIDARFVVVAFEEALGDEGHQVSVSHQVCCQQRHVGFVAHGTVEAPPGRDVRLAAQNGREPHLARRVVKLHRAVHHAVVRQRDGRRSGLRRPAAKLVDSAGAVEQRVFGVDVQMDELIHGQDS